MWKCQVKKFKQGVCQELVGKVMEFMFDDYRFSVLQDEKTSGNGGW